MILSVAFILFAYAIDSIKATQCPDGWQTTEFDQKCFKFFLTGMRYIDAEDFCHAQGPSGHLVSIHNRFELNAVGDFVASATGVDVLFWIGLDNLRSGNSNAYTWIDGTKLDYLSWYPGGNWPAQPEAADSNPCTCMFGPNRADVSQRLKWFTYECGGQTCESPLPFLCELNKPTNPP